MAVDYGTLLQKIIGGEDLAEEEAFETFGSLMSGELSEVRMAALLAALAAKGHAVTEIAGAARAMRDAAVRIAFDGEGPIVDIVGTGGTGVSTFNVSTASCFVAAGAGATVAKHGNVTNTRSSGAADVLRALGVNIDIPAATVTLCIQESGMGFCFARKCHPAMKNVAGVRKDLPVRTIFNILGPLTNPAGAKHFLMGVFSTAWTGILAQVLRRLGAERAWVVCGADGMDEISVTGPTTIARLEDGTVDTWTLHPADYGIAEGTLADLAVCSPEESAARIRGVLAGQQGVCRNIVLLNAAAALAVAGHAPGMEAGLAAAAESIDSGAAEAVLEKLVTLSAAGA